MSGGDVLVVQEEADSSPNKICGNPRADVSATPKEDLLPADTTELTDA